MCERRYTHGHTCAHRLPWCDDWSLLILSPSPKARKPLFSRHIRLFDSLGSAVTRDLSFFVSSSAIPSSLRTPDSDA